MQKDVYADDLYCKLYVNTDSKELIDTVAVILQGKLTQRTIITSVFAASVIKNKLSDKGAQPFSDEECVSFPWYLEIDGFETINRAEFIQAVAALMQGLRERGCRVVASCDFEDELPAGASAGE